MLGTAFFSQVPTTSSVSTQTRADSLKFSNKEKPPSLVWFAQILSALHGALHVWRRKEQSCNLTTPVSGWQLSTAWLPALEVEQSCSSLHSDICIFFLWLRHTHHLKIASALISMQSKKVMVWQGLSDSSCLINTSFTHGFEFQRPFALSHIHLNLWCCSTTTKTLHSLRISDSPMSCPYCCFERYEKNSTGNTAEILSTEWQSKPICQLRNAAVQLLL